MRLLFLSALPLVIALGACPLLADGDHDRARAALERGEVLPLATLLERLQTVIDGEVIATEFDRDDGRWIYEIEYIDRDGRVVELEVDAADGRILEREVD
jgi:uncharacterized membrane protein YkoI